MRAKNALVGVTCLLFLSIVDGKDVLVVYFAASDATKGTVKVRVNGSPLSSRETICWDSSSWGMEEASVTCRQMGFLKAISTVAINEAALQPIIFNVRCSGKETNLADCSYSASLSGSLSCTSQQHVKVSCLRNPGVIVGPIVVVVCLIILGIIVIVLWKRGITCFGRKTRTPDGNGLYDETRVPYGANTGGFTGNYVNVGGVYENVSEPVYVNSAFAADQAMEANRDSCEYENMRDIVFNQASIAGIGTASAEESIVQNQDNEANNSTGADVGESQYAKLETLNRSEYADFRGLTAEQLKPI